MADELKTMAEELKTTAISKLPEAISVSEGDCILVVQNRKAKKARPSLFRGPKGDTGLTGATGANPVLKFSSRGIEAKLSNQADSAFTLLVPIASITGPTGPQGLTGATGANIIPRAGETGIEYKLSTEPDTAYRLLVPYSLITGPQGEPGKDFQILGYFDTFNLLETTIVNPNPGDAYGVGTAAPYPIYIWDAIGERWRDNGAIQGPAGRSGKSARVNTNTGYWEEFDDDTLTWKDTEYIAIYSVATSEKDGLMSKDDKAKLDQIKGGDIEVSKENIEKVLTGDIISHQHGRVVNLVETPTDIWDGISISSSLSGTGSVDDPYLINTCADWIHFVNNGPLYSPDASGWQSEPTWEMFSHIKVTHNLDFNNQPLDFAEFWNTDLSSLPAGVLIYAVIDGCGCRFENINIYNWFSLFCCGVGIYVHHLSIGSGKFVLDVSKKNKDILFFPLAPVVTEDYVPSISTAYCSCKASFETEGVLTEDTYLSVCLSSTGILNTMGMEEVKEGYCYGNNQFVNHCDVSNHILQIGYIPIFYSKPTESGDTTILNIYDCSHANLLPTDEVTSGFYVLGIDFSSEISSSVLNLFYNSETMTLMNAGTGSSKFTAKTREEIKSTDFLTILNCGTDTFVIDENMINEGYPILKPSIIEHVVFEGYVNNTDLKNLEQRINKKTVLSIPYLQTGSHSSFFVEKMLNAIGGIDKLMTSVMNEEKILLKIIADNIPINCNIITDFCMETSEYKQVVLMYLFLIGQMATSISYNKTTKQYSLGSATSNGLNKLILSSDSKAGKIKINGAELFPGNFIKVIGSNELIAIEKIPGMNITFSKINKIPSGFNENIIYVTTNIPTRDCTMSVKPSSVDANIFEVTGEITYSEPYNG